MIPKSEWVWYGFAGHLIVSERCAYYLCTRIGSKLVSTVGPTNQTARVNSRL